MMDSKPVVESNDAEERSRIIAHYEVNGSTAAEARAKADLICLDQTIEAGEEILTTTLRAKIIGRVEAIHSRSSNRFEVRVTFSADLLVPDCASLLGLLFGMSSFRPGVRLLSFDLPTQLLSQWSGSRFGLRGLRDATGVHHRAFVCAVLKPLGLSPSELADLALQFTLGGVDLIKDDQSLIDQPFCPFEERVARCSEAVAKGTALTGRPCFYMPHVSGPLDRMRQRAQLAKKAGAAGLLIAPGLTGFDALRALAEDKALGLPIASHPSFLGSYAMHQDGGLAPAVLYGQLPRLAGADVSIYPSYDSGYAMTKDECVAVAEACRSPWDRVRPTVPSAAGRIGIAQVAELGATYGRDVMFILGSRIQQDRDDLTMATERFVREVERATGG